jgi:acetyltransferase-like isoleucine patch superfamily enzyme
MSIGTIIRKFNERNWLATHAFAQACGRRGLFVCRGRIQVNLSLEAKITAPRSICYVGLPLVGWIARNEVTTVSVERGGQLDLDGALIGRGTQIWVGEGSRFSIGGRSYIAGASRVGVSNLVSIGSDCAISWGVTIIDDDGHGASSRRSAPIAIGDRVWIGCNAIILKGVSIGEGSVVGAGSVVTKSCAPRSLLVGVPARAIRNDISWIDVSPQATDVRGSMAAGGTARA